MESTSNWYWLVDGLMEADYRVHLAHPAAMPQYSGLKSTDDSSDAHWLAHVLRLGVLPEGYLYPKAERDVLRKRAHVVRQQTATVLSLHNISVRNTGVRLSTKRMHELTLEDLECLLPEPDPILAVTSRLAVLHCLGQHSNTLEQLVHTRLKPTPTSAQLRPSWASGRLWPRRLCWRRAICAAFPRWEYRKNKATFHASPPGASPHLARVPAGSSRQPHPHASGWRAR